MGGKKKKETKEKPLDKMTATELRELAKSAEGIVGVSGMNKAELLAAIKESRGIVDTDVPRKSYDVRVLKAKIKELRDKQSQAKDANNIHWIDTLRRRISNLKKKTRR